MPEKKQTTPPPEKEQVTAPQVEAAQADDLDPVEEIEVMITEMLDTYSQPHVRGRYDQRLIAIARTQIELGFLALHKAVWKAEADEAREGGIDVA